LTAVDPEPGLRRVLGPFDAAWIVAGSMIGAGIFFFPGIVAGRLPGWGWPFLAWGLGGFLAVCGAAVYAELGARLPRAGGDYRYLAAAFGPLWGFLSGWAAMLLTFSAAAAMMCVVAAGYLRAALPVLGTAGSIDPIAPCAVALLTGANMVSARTGGRTTAWLTASALVGLALLFGAGLVAGRAPLRWPEAFPEVQGSWAIAFGVSMIPVYFTYSGWSTAAYVAGEIRDPGRNLARGLLGGTLFVTLVYLAVNAIFLVAVPQADLAGSTTAGALAARRLLGPAAERVLALLIATAVFGTANVTLMGGARIYYAMAQDGLAPRSLARTTERGVPHVAVLLGGIWTGALSTVSRVETLVNWATLAILLLSSLAVCALFVLRRRGGPRPAFSCPAYPWTPLVYLAASLAVATASAVAEPLQSLYGVAIAAAGAPVYWLIRRL
jgi:APA family basic amino acid/polyamine antiporter